LQETTAGREKKNKKKKKKKKKKRKVKFRGTKAKCWGRVGAADVPKLSGRPKKPRARDRKRQGRSQALSRREYALPGWKRVLDERGR